jgi:hypothetical protein
MIGHFIVYGRKQKWRITGSRQKYTKFMQIKNTTSEPLAYGFENCMSSNKCSAKTVPRLQVLFPGEEKTFELIFNLRVTPSSPDEFGGAVSEEKTNLICFGEINYFNRGGWYVKNQPDWKDLFFYEIEMTEEQLRYLDLDFKIEAR